VQRDINLGLRTREPRLLPRTLLLGDRELGRQRLDPLGRAVQLALRLGEAVAHRR
jgi:hypothetical protein